MRTWKLGLRLRPTAGSSSTSGTRLGRRATRSAPPALSRETTHPSPTSASICACSRRVVRNCCITRSGPGGFLVLAGDSRMLVEEEERQLRAWDFLHCPPGTRHAFIATGDSPCVIVMAGARTPESPQKGLFYPRSELALRHGVGVEQETSSWPKRWRRFRGGASEGRTTGTHCPGRSRTRVPRPRTVLTIHATELVRTQERAYRPLHAQSMERASLLSGSAPLAIDQGRRAEG